MEEKALTVKQIAEYLQVNERTIYKLAQTGKIPCFKVAGTWRFWKRDIEEWTRNRTTKLENEDDK
ncbi:MAG: DNA-binding protein [Armatimonadetes bacterium CG07_land_8_20_14_0_80_40_9]|nr:MAG: DNA-binding protein [Armatimonadetes bacterium CG07_land_8_20_14_0_80_40_9]